MPATFLNELKLAVFALIKSAKESKVQVKDLPIMRSGSSVHDRAFRIAIGDICSNLVVVRQGQLEEPRTCLAAGINYPTLWTRDNALNTVNFSGLFLPDVAENSLRSVLEYDESDGEWQVGGQYWDAMIWAWGAWSYFLSQGNFRFLQGALKIIERSMQRFESREFDDQIGLFRGPAFFQDGISGYPDELSGEFGSDVRDWVGANPASRHPDGFGIPWFALSTNCLYARAYEVTNLMRKALSLESSEVVSRKEQSLKAAIRRNFWNAERESFDYLILDGGRRFSHQEGAGLALAVIFDIASPQQQAAVFRNAWTAPAGIPCVWPRFERFSVFGDNHFGRHCGTVWPHVQALWAKANLMAGRDDVFHRDLQRMAYRALRDGHFTELYHPITGEEYGGLQERSGVKSIDEWDAVPHTTWGATSFIDLVVSGVLGLRFDTEGVSIAPNVPTGMAHIEVDNIPYRQAKLRVSVRGEGRVISRCTVNGESSTARIPAAVHGETDVQIEMG
jgi:hypothetical protein